MTGDLEDALRSIRETLLEKPVSPRVERPADINRHYCRYVAEAVLDRLDDPADVRVLEDGSGGFAHVWLCRDGRHYDAECVEGVDEYADLPFFQRHPGAVDHVEPGSVDQAALRQRGTEPLYPDFL